MDCVIQLSARVVGSLMQIGGLVVTGGPVGVKYCS